MTVIAQDDHLTAGAWATCGSLCLKEDENVYLRERITMEGAFQTKVVQERDRGSDNQPLTGNKPTPRSATYERAVGIRFKKSDTMRL